MIDVSPFQLEIIQKILNKHVPDAEVRAFGSRVTWTAKDYSDLDLAVVGKEKFADNIMYALKEDFEESDLPFRVEALDWNGISKEFRQVIQKNYEVIQIAIAKIISDLDEKIELNHQMNRTLEEIAQAIFKRWFVEFEFPVFAPQLAPRPLHPAFKFPVSLKSLGADLEADLEAGYKSSGAKMVDSDTIIDQFDEVIKPIEMMICKNEDENRRLFKIRDSLLPKLMSGKIRVA